MPNMQERLETAIERTETDSSLFHDMVHGTDTETVTTENGEVPTMAKALKDVRNELYGQASSLVNMAQAAADDAANSVLLAQAEVRNAQAEVVNTRQEGQRAKEELETVGANIISLAQAEVQNAKQEVRNAQAEVVNAQTEVQNAAAEVVKAKAEVTKAEQEVQKAKDEVENAKAEVRNAQAEVVNAQTEVQNAAAEVVKAKAEVTNAKAEVQNAKAEVNNAKAEVTKAKTWAEGTDAEVQAQGGIHSCQKWVELAQQATIGNYPVTVTGVATANQTVLPLNLDEPLGGVDQVLTVIIENTALLPENYTISNNGQSVILLNPLAAGERWCVKCLFELQSMAGMIDCVMYEEMQGETP